MKRWKETFHAGNRKITVIIRARSMVEIVNPEQRGAFGGGYSAKVRDGQNKLVIPLIDKQYVSEAQQIAYAKFVEKFY